ncbi:MAG: hypothetical protein J1E40_12055 [Oscillospiraceae bacterium]|nr:hypothetical protein [Oscillospiraceae bacterium]
MAKKKIILTICLIMTLCFSLCILYKPIYYRLYLGDRIKGNIEIEIDNKAYSIEENKIDFHSSGKSKMFDDGTAGISIRAGEYGIYSLEILGTPIEKPISIRCYQYNWWNVMDFELTIKIDTAQNEINYNGNYMTIADNGKKIYNPINYTQSLTDEYIQLSFGL